MILEKVKKTLKFFSLFKRFKRTLLNKLTIILKIIVSNSCRYKKPYYICSITITKNKTL